MLYRRNVAKHLFVKESLKKKMLSFFKIGILT